MDKTRVDDILIEMITPQVKAIEEKFSRGEGLTQTDIHTLLLKSQYNHINHLDQKLDEVTASVVALEGKFQTVKAEMSAEFEKRMGSLETKFEQAQVKMQDTIISTMKWYIGGAGVVLILLKALDIFVPK
jgi:replication fork clamp-binding protein CrfC